MQQRAEDPPRCVKLVVTDKVGVVTLERVENERLVSFRDLEVREAATISQIELRDDSLHAEAGKLRVHLDVHTLVRLHADHEFVAGNVLKNPRGNVLELDADLGLLLVQG